MMLLAPETAPLMDFTGPQSLTINVIRDAYSTLTQKRMWQQTKKWAQKNNESAP